MKTIVLVTASMLLATACGKNNETTSAPREETSARARATATPRPASAAETARAELKEVFLKMKGVNGIGIGKNIADEKEFVRVYAETEEAVKALNVLLEDFTYKGVSVKVEFAGVISAL